MLVFGGVVSVSKAGTVGSDPFLSNFFYTELRCCALQRLFF